MRPLPPLPLSVPRFTGIPSYSYTDQKKVEADDEVTEDRTGDLSLRKPRTSQTEPRLLEEVANMDRRTRKILAMCGCLHTRSNVVRLYLQRKEGGIGLIGSKEWVRRRANPSMAT